MVYRPPFTLPFSSDGRPPPRVNVTVNTDGWQDPAQDPIVAAGQLIDGLGSEIRQFVSQQRQAVDAGIVDVHRKAYSFDGLDVTYRSHFGHEDIRFVAYPVSQLPQPTPTEELPTEVPIPVTPIDILSTIAVQFLKGST